MTVALKFEIDMVKMYSHTKNEFSVSRHSTNGHTHAQTVWKRHLPALLAGNYATCWQGCYWFHFGWCEYMSSIMRYCHPVYFQQWFFYRIISRTEFVCVYPSTRIWTFWFLAQLSHSLLIKSVWRKPCTFTRAILIIHHENEISVCWTNRPLWPWFKWILFRWMTTPVTIVP